MVQLVECPPKLHARNQQYPGSTVEIKTEMNPILNPGASGPEGSLIGIPIPNIWSPLQAGIRADPDMLMKLKLSQLLQQQQNKNQMQQQLQQLALSGQRPQSSNLNLQQAGSVAGDGSISNSFRGNDQVATKVFQVKMELSVEKLAQRGFTKLSVSYGQLSLIKTLLDQINPSVFMSRESAS